MANIPEPKKRRRKRRRKRSKAPENIQKQKNLLKDQGNLLKKQGNLPAIQTEEEILDNALPSRVRNILKRLERAGYEAWCVGGGVRDLLLGRTPQDWDVTTSALPDEVKAVFRGRAIPTGLKHGTQTILSGPQGGVEVTTFRCDGDYTDHRRPDTVTFTRSLDQDLKRRDFTVNAIALNLRGLLHDPCGGQRDLSAGLIRCVGDPDRRFGEDALRIMRGVRFASVLNFRLESETARAIHRNRDLLGLIAPERIQAELYKLLCGPRCVEILREFPDVMGVFWPEILTMKGFEQRNIHHCYDVWEHTLHALEALDTMPMPEGVRRDDLPLRCALLLHDIGKPSCCTTAPDGQRHFPGHPVRSRELADDMLRRLRCANALREQVLLLVEQHDRQIPVTEKAVRHALSRFTPEDLRRLFALKRADNLAQSPAFRERQEQLDCAEKILSDVLAKQECVSLKQLAVNGLDMQKLSLRGPEIGQALRMLLERVLNGESPNERDALIQAAREFQSDISGA